MKKAAASQRTPIIMMFFAFAFGMILSNLLHTQSIRSDKKDSQETLFIYRGVEKTQVDMLESDRSKIETLNKQKITAIETAALRQHFLDQAKIQNIDVEDVAKQLLHWQPVSDEEVYAFYQQNKQRLNKPFYEVEKHIKLNLEQRQANLARQALLSDLKQKGDLAILPGR